MTKLKWEEPSPSRTTNRSKWREIADQLRERPGEWALVAEGFKYSVYATYINKGRLAPFEPSGSFEGTSRKREDGKFDIYARFVGDD